jgi:hypothetical protein
VCLHKLCCTLHLYNSLFFTNQCRITSISSALCINVRIVRINVASTHMCITQISVQSQVQLLLRVICYSNKISFIVDFALDMPLRRTYASLSLDTPSEFTVNTHDTTSAQSVLPVPSPTPALQPKVGKPIVKLPNTSSRFRSSLLSPRRSLLRVHCRSSHLDRQIFPHFKPGLNLYRHVLSREFLRATNLKKATMDNVEAPTSCHNDDQGSMAST